MTRQRVENDMFLVRETASGAVLNTDKMAYEAIKANKQNRKQTEASLKSEVEELRRLVSELIERQR